jgi:hypothetical protein
MSGSMGSRERMPNLQFPAAKSLEKYNPAELMLDKHKKLKLTDAQQQQLKGLRAQFFERNAGVLARYDSLQREYKPPQMAAGGPQAGGRGGRSGRSGGMGRESGDGSEAQDSTRRAALRQVVQLRHVADSLLERRRTDVRDVLNALTDEAQRKKAAEFLDKQDIKFAKEFPSLPGLRNSRGPEGEGGPVRLSAR